MKRNLDLYLQDIWESINLIEDYLHSITEDMFCSNIQLQDAVIRRLEIIGEAAKNIDDDFRVEYSLIPWRKIAGLRDVIAHEYFGVKLERIWRIVKTDLPELKQQMTVLREINQK